MRYILKDNAPLKHELQHGRLYNQLVYSVKVARNLIHYSSAGTNTNNTDNNQHCEEWPLALSYDLRTDERINTVLYWDDLQAIEREYVQRIEQRVAAAVEQVEGIYFNCSWLWLWQQEIMLTQLYRSATRYGL